MKKIIGVDLGGTTTKFGIFDLKGNIIHKWSIQTDTKNEGSHIIPNIIENINNKLKEFKIKNNEVIGIGMGSPGKIDLKNGRVSDAFNLNLIPSHEVIKPIKELTKIRCCIDNDANVAALGEKWLGAGNNEDNIVFIGLGTGVGGGIIINNQLVHGIAGVAGEIGHICVDINGLMCTCGNRGCLETVASATGIINVARSLANEFKAKSNIKDKIINNKAISSKDIFNAAKEQNDLFALAVVEKVSMYLGNTCANIANVLNPSSIIIGGGVSESGEFLIKKIEQYYRLSAFPPIRHSTKIKLATLKSDAGIIGAAYLALNKFYNN